MPKLRTPRGERKMKELEGKERERGEGKEGRE